jgi:hypothetical protein
MKSIVKWIVLWLFDHYSAEIDKILKAERSAHLHKNPSKKPVNMNTEKMAGSQEGATNE